MSAAVLCWTATGMRDKGIGEYVARRDYDALTARVAELEAALNTALWYVTSDADEAMIKAVLDKGAL